jgi:hypothetical protein
VSIAIWHSESSSAIAGPVGDMIVAVPVNHGEELQLAFDKRTNRMVQWNHRAW